MVYALTRGHSFIRGVGGIGAALLSLGGVGTVLPSLDKGRLAALADWSHATVHLLPVERNNENFCK